MGCEQALMGSGDSCRAGLGSARSTAARSRDLRRRPPAQPRPDPQFSGMVEAACLGEKLNTRDSATSSGSLCAAHGGLPHPTPPLQTIAHLLFFYARASSGVGTVTVALPGRSVPSFSNSPLNSHGLGNSFFGHWQLHHEPRVGHAADGRSLQICGV